MHQYIVQPGDSLYSIAGKYNITVANLIKVNQIINPYMIFPWQILNIPSPNVQLASANCFPPITIRDTGPLVILAQSRLKKINAYKGKIDGVFGPITHKSIVNFQQGNKLLPTGQVDITTWRYLLDDTNYLNGYFSSTPPYKAYMVLAGLFMVLSTNKKEYEPDEIVHLSLLKINLSESSITLNFNTNQRYDFKVVTPSGQVLWLWSGDKDISQSSGTLSIKPGQMIRYRETYKIPKLSEQHIDQLHISGRSLSKQLELLKLSISIRIKAI